MYEISDKEQADLERRFTYHPSKEGQPARYESIRQKAFDFAEALCQMCPNSQERAVALTSLDKVVMYANAAIARNE